MPSNNDEQHHSKPLDADQSKVNPESNIDAGAGPTKDISVRERWISLAAGFLSCIVLLFGVPRVFDLLQFLSLGADKAAASALSPDLKHVAFIHRFNDYWSEVIVDSPVILLNPHIGEYSRDSVVFHKEPDEPHDETIQWEGSKQLRITYSIKNKSKSKSFFVSQAGCSADKDVSIVYSVKSSKE